MRRYTVGLLTLSFLSFALPLHAADQAVLGKLLLIKDPGAAEKRKVVMKAKEPNSSATIVGDPTVNGATLVIDAVGGSTNSETYTLPIGTSPTTGKPYWTGDAVKGFLYKDKAGENGPVKIAQIKKTGGGTLQIKAVLNSKLAPIALRPPNEGTRGCAMLTIGGGDSYSVRFADGTIKNKGAELFKAVNPTSAGTCINCDPLDGTDCLFPFPSDWFTIDDPSTDTGKRVNFSRAVMPRNGSGVPIDFEAYNQSDGFSPGASIMLRVPNVDLAMTGAAPVTDIERSLDVGAPVVVVNATTLAHHLMFVELDANATTEASRALIIRPAVNFDEATRYIVALRQMKDGTGALIPPGADFLAYRDNTPTGDPVKESRRPHMEAVFTTLAAAGVPRNDLYLAWDFTVASERNNTERLLFMRDDAFTRLGTNAPAFTVTNVENELDSRIFRRVSGTFQVERYVDTTAPGAKFVLGPDGLPLHQGIQVAPFQCIIPRAALANAAATAVPARASIYGHGLLGSHTEVASNNVRDMANEHNFVFCATKWIGMSDDDVPNAIATLQQLGKFPAFTDRLQQAMLNQLFLARLMIHGQGLISDPAFQDLSGDPVIDTSDVFYDGNSQGGIFGGTVMSIAQDITRGVLGVPGMNYSLLLTRSIDFDLYKAFFYPAYPNELYRPLGLALIQMLWDRSEPNGYAHHMVNNLLPNTPAHQVLLHVAFGDHQVANLATEIEARTIGIPIHQPAIAGGRHSDVNPYFGIAAVPSDPYAGSALIIWDSGAATPPITNLPPTIGGDPHSHPRNDVDARQQKSDFLKTAGMVVDICAAAPCTVP